MRKLLRRLAVTALVFVATAPVAVTAQAASATPTDASEHVVTLEPRGGDFVVLPGQYQTVYVPLLNNSRTAQVITMQVGAWCSFDDRWYTAPFKVKVRGDTGRQPNLIPDAVVVKLIRIPVGCTHSNQYPADGFYSSKTFGKFPGERTNAFRIGKPFTAENARYNLAVRTGSVPRPYAAHHTMPQKFEAWFRGKGLNIHNPKYLVWWCSKTGVPTNHGAKAYEYNKSWESYIRTYPRASQASVLAWRLKLDLIYRKYYRCP